MKLRYYLEKKQKESIDEHKIILEALIKKDKKLAERLMKKHIENGEEVLFQEIKLRENNSKKNKNSILKKEGLFNFMTSKDCN